MRKAVLEDHLRREARFGNTIRANTTWNTHQFLLRYRRQSGRTYHDLLRIIISIYKKRPNFFDQQIPGGRWVVNVRLSRAEAGWCLDRAWIDGMSRANFLGSLLNVFVNKVPTDKIIKALSEQKDRVLRLIGGLNGRHAC